MPVSCKRSVLLVWLNNRQEGKQSSCMHFLKQIHWSEMGEWIINIGVFRHAYTPNFRAVYKSLFHSWECSLCFRLFFRYFDSCAAIQLFCPFHTMQITSCRTIILAFKDYSYCKGNTYLYSTSVCFCLVGRRVRPISWKCECARPWRVWLMPPGAECNSQATGRKSHAVKRSGKVKSRLVTLVNVGVQY